MKIPFQIRQKWYQGGFKMHNSELVYLKNFWGGGLQRTPNPPAAWARFARLAPPEKPMVPAWPPQLGIPSYATG